MEQWKEVARDNYNFLVRDKNWKSLIAVVKDLIKTMDKFSDLSGRSDISVTFGFGELLPVPQNMILQSSAKTLQTILFCLQYGYLADVYMLIRKYRDDLIFYLYLEIQSQKLIDDNGDLNSDKKTGKWLKNKLSHCFWRDFLKEVESSEIINKAKAKFDLFKCFCDQNLNDYTHANGIKFYNRNMFYLTEVELKKESANIEKKIKSIFHDFLFSIILLRPNAIISNDYEELLMTGLMSIEGSQYIVDSVMLKYIRKNFSYSRREYLQSITNLKL